ncbi:hypothetical protein BDV96DRAFT_259798 [Lophiotrema nucula]|uniref:Uncharacterized protein n=1 Tax=Lophiotrema nucula TaxID=690887 RepID=A0A6A5YN85_9PLEO|nr:hypothetical protein BDV96DRAFT_259798 [Lophiotrema nucula]
MNGHEHFRFLELPAEIRNNIYTMVFSSHDHAQQFIEDIKTIEADVDVLKEFPKRSVRGNNLALLLTCRIVLSEAQTLASSLTTFLMRCKTLSDLSHNVGTRNRVNTINFSNIASLTVPVIGRIQLSGGPHASDRFLEYDLWDCLSSYYIYEAIKVSQIPGMSSLRCFNVIWFAPNDEASCFANDYSNPLWPNLEGVKVDCLARNARGRNFWWLKRMGDITPHLARKQHPERSALHGTEYLELLLSWTPREPSGAPQKKLDFGIICVKPVRTRPITEAIPKE